MCGQLSSEITEKLKNAMALSLHSTKKKKKATNSEIQIATITAFIPLTRSQPPVVKETSSGKFLEL